MSATLERALVPPRISIAHTARGRAVLALARFEGRRLARHPIFLTFMALGPALFVILTWDRAPVLHRDDILTGLSLLPAAAGLFLAASLAALRDRRHGTEELYSSLALDPADRTAGLLLGLLWPAAVSAALVALEMGFLAALRSVGSPSPAELLTGPAVVLMGGAMGVAASRWFPSAAAGPVALVGLARLQVWLQSRLTGGDLDQAPERWLAPWVPMAAGGEPARELVLRPSGWHLAYVLGIALVMAGVALLRHGGRRLSIVVAGSAVAVTVVAGTLQMRSPTAAQVRALEDLVLHPERHQVCRTVETVRYCAHPAYAPWIDRWAAAVEGALARVPHARRPSVVVRQGLSQPWATVLAGRPGLDPAHGDLGTPPGTAVVRPGSDWGRWAAEGPSELGISLTVAGWSVGLPMTPDQIVLTEGDIDRLVAQTPRKERALVRATLESDPGSYGSCTPAGQARTVVALWLAAMATPRTGPSYAAVIADDPYGPTGLLIDGQGNTTLVGGGQYELSDLMHSFSGEAGLSLQWPRAEAHIALQLAARPVSDVAPVLAANWDGLTDPVSPTRDILRLFGLEPPPTARQQLRAAGIDPTEAEDLGAGYEVPCR